ncbi:MAG TPA: hypothetical protein DCM86_00140, partial [Verrucomicrobiales bacterium]|nr:hypothetical protein [Verrucomicrobiales bacterium]
MKLETNLEGLKNIGIDLKLAGVLQINTTRTDKVEKLTLKGIPGDEFAHYDPATDTERSSLIDSLNAGTGTIPPVFQGFFQAAGDKDPNHNPLRTSGYQIVPVIPGSLWRIDDSLSGGTGRQYYIQLTDVSALPVPGGAPVAAQYRFIVRNETQAFTLTAKTLLIAAYGQAVFHYPAFTDASKTQMGPEWFRASGAFQLKISTTGLEFFENGVLTISPGGTPILDIRGQAALIIQPDGLAGQLMLSASINLPGMQLTGAFEGLINTFGATKTLQLSPFIRDAIPGHPVSIVIGGRAPKVNENYVTNGSAGDLLLEDPTVAPGAYFSIGIVGHLSLLNTITLDGAFKLTIGTQQLSILAAVHTAITNPFNGGVLFSLGGSASITLDRDGIYGRVDFALATNDLVPGFKMNAEFLLEFNTAGASKQVQSYVFSATDGSKSASLTTVSLAARTLHLAAGGTLKFSLDSHDAVTLAGRFEFTLSPSLLEIQASVSVSSPVVNGSASGALRIDSNGLAGFISIGVSAGVGAPGAGQSITGTGFEVNFRLAFYINTGNATTVAGVNLNGHEIKLEAAGYVAFSLAGIVGFRIDGSVIVTVNGDGFNVEVHGMLSAQVFGATLLRLKADGTLAVTNAAPTGQPKIFLIAGSLALQVGSNGVLDGNGFHFSANLTLQVNTTGKAVAGLVAGVYVRVHADGDLSFQTADQTGLLLHGLFDLEVGTNGLSIAAAAQLRAQVLGVTILEFQSDGALLLNQYGIAASITVSIGSLAPSSGSGFTLGGDFSFQLNTTNQAIASIGGVAVNLAPGPYVRLSIAGRIQLTLVGGTGFLLEGSLVMTAGASGLEIAAAANLKAVFAGFTLLSLPATGALLINQYGLAAKITLHVGLGYGGSGFHFGGSFVFALNTTNRYVGSIAGQQVDLQAGPYARISASGDLEILGVFKVYGGFLFEYSTQGGLLVHADAHVNVLGISLSLTADLLINSSGLVFRGALSFTTANSFIPFPGVEITGAFMLEINTTSSAKSLGGFTLAAQTVRIRIDGALNIIGFKASGTLIITAGAGGLRIEVPESSPLKLVVGPFQADLSGFIDSNGTWRFNAHAGLHLDAGPAYLDVDAYLTVGNDIFRFHLDGSAGLRIFGVNIGVSVHADVTIQNNYLHVSVQGCIDTFLGSACATVDFTIGSLQPPGAPQPDPEPTLATLMPDGTLRLNTGPNAQYRVVAAYNTDTDESYTVAHVSTQGASETVTVSAFGYTQTYSGVLRIFADGGDGNDFIQLEPGIIVPADLHGGAGDDTLFYGGSATATLCGDDGNDTLVVGAASNGSNVLNGGAGDDKLQGGPGADTLNGGPGDDTLYGGPGNDTLVGGPGIDEVNGNEGDDTLVWAVGDGVDKQLEGGAGTLDRLQLTLTSAPDIVAFSASFNGGFQVLVSGTGLMILTVETADVYSLGGADSLTVNALDGSLLRDITLRLGAPESPAALDSVTVNGTSAANAYTLSATANSMDIARTGAEVIHLLEAGSAEAGTALTLNLGAGADTVAFDQTLAGVTTTINGGEGDDILNVAQGSSVEGVAGQVIFNGDAGNDTLNLEDSDAAPASGFLSGSRIWGFGMPGSDPVNGGIGYAAVEVLNLRLGGRADTLNILSTAAATLTTIDLGPATGDPNVVNLGSKSPATGGTLNGLLGRLVVSGAGASDTLNLDDTGDLLGNTGTLTASSLVGLGLGGNDPAKGLQFSGIEILNINLGAGADNFTILSTGTGTTTVNANGEADRIAIRAFSGPLTVRGGDGSDTFNIGSNANPLTNNGGNVNSMTGGLTLSGDGNTTGPGDAVVIDDTADTLANTGSLSGNQVLGLGMTPGITYSAMEFVTVNLGSGGDTFNVLSASPTTVTAINANGGNDTVTLTSVGSAPVSIDVGAGNDVIHGSPGNDVLIGGPGDDIIDGGGGSDTIYGNGGNDTLTATGTEGSTLDGGDGNDILNGSEGPDTLRGGAGNDQIFGNGGNDTIYGGAGDDSIQGGAGNDILYAGSPESFNTPDADVIDGGDGNDTIFGSLGVNQITGGAGDDYIDGAGGGDTLQGGDGNDVLIARGTTAATLDGGAGNDLIQGTEAGDTIHGGAGNDRIYGNGGNDNIYGDAGNDVIDAGAGNDIVEGGAGSDVLLGGAGDDTLYAYAQVVAGDDKSINYLYGDFGTNLNETGSGNDKLVGGGANDLLFGEGGTDQLLPGGAGTLIDQGTSAVGGPNTSIVPLALAPGGLTNNQGTGLSLPADLNVPGRWAELNGSGSGNGVSGSIGSGFDPSIVAGPNGQYLAWADSRSGNLEIYVAQHTTSGQWVQLAGSARDGGISATPGASRRPSLSLGADGQPIVAWTEFNGVASDIRVARFDATASAGAGAWVALGTSLGGGGISATGAADRAVIVSTTAGPVVAWVDLSSGKPQAYAKRFAAGAWTALGTGAASGGGLSASSTGVSDLSVATDGSLVAAAWSALDGAAHQQVYLRQFNGTAWIELAGSGSGSGISQNVGPSRSPSLAYLGGALFVAWQQQQPGVALPIDIQASVYAGSVWSPAGTGALDPGGVSHSAGVASQPRIASNGGRLVLAWADTTPGSPTRLYSRVWDGTSFVEQLPGDASFQGIATLSVQFQTLALTADASGHPFAAWDDVFALRPSVYVLGNTFDLKRVFTADSATSIQSILDAQTLTLGDVIVVSRGTTYAGGVNISADDAGVTILGAADGSTVIQGGVTVTRASDVILQRLTLAGGVTATATDRLTLTDDVVGGTGLSLAGGVDVRVVDSRFNGTVGIRTAAPTAGWISRNTLTASATGLDLAAAFSGLVTQNDISGAVSGVAYGAAAALGGNQIHNNTTGVNVTAQGEAAGLGFVGASLPRNEISGNQVGVTLALGARVRGQDILSNVTGATGSGVLGGNELDTANLIDGNTTGVNFTGVIQFNRISNNGVGIAASNGQGILHNLIYRNTQAAILVEARADVRIVSNTIYSPLGDSIRVQGGSSNVEVRSNIVWSETGYDLYVANDSQAGFFSNYNDLHASGTGKVAYWTKDFTDILDLQADVAYIDLNSIGRTSVHPDWSEPRFYNRGADDYRIFDLVGGQRFSSPTIDGADPLTDAGVPVSQVNLLANPGFEAWVAGWTTSVGAGTRADSPAAYAGSSYFFAAGNGQGFAEQVIDLTAAGFNATQLDSQDLVVVFGGRVRTLDKSPRDQGQIKLDFLDSTGAVIGVGGLGAAQNLIDRWELTGARVHVPVGTRSIRYRFEANRQSGSENDSFLDGAFAYVLNDTVAPDQGAYGNTASEAAQSTRARIALRFPDLYTDWERDKPRLIRWESYNNVTESNVRIDLYRDDPVNGPTLLTTIAAATADDGEYSWIPSSSGINFGTQGLRIQISFVSDPTVLDRSTETFTVPESGDTYYVDDASNANDEYTPGAIGDNRHTGKTADAPKPNPINVLRTYELSSGSVLNIDTGLYPMIYTAVMTSRAGVGLGIDRGFLFRGPTDPSRTAELTTAIPGNTSQALLYLDDADLMQVRFLTLTGGRVGIQATDGTNGFTGERLVVRNNAQQGILFDGGSDFTLLKDVTITNHPGYDGLSLNGGAGGAIENLVSSYNRYGLYAGSLGTLTIKGAAIFGNAWAGIRQEGGTTGSFDTLEIHNNGSGLELFGTFTVTNARVYESAGNGIYSNGGLTLRNSDVHGNADGIVAEGGTIDTTRIYGNAGVGIRATVWPLTITGDVIYSNQYGVVASAYAGGVFTIANTLFYDHAVDAILLAQKGPSAYEITNNTLYETVADGIHANASDNIHLRNNIVWTQKGYGIYIDNDSQIDFTSNFNDLYATGSGKVGYWQGDRATLSAWQFSNFRDGDSLSADPLFVNPAGADGVVGAANFQGLTATYYAGLTWSGTPVVTRTERQPGFQGYGIPAPGLGDDNWSGVWQGYLLIPTAGDYTFYINSLGPQQLIVDGQTLVNDAADPGAERAAVYHATSPGRVSFVYKVADDGAQSNVHIEWMTPGAPRGGVLVGQFTTTATLVDGTDDNFHEQSLFGSYKPGTGFSADLLQSPTIDRGQPSDTFAAESAPAGGYINLGAYGNTAQASKSPVKYILLTNPDGGERLPQKTTFNIRWRSDGFTGNVRIEVSANGETGPFTDITPSTANTGSYSWNVSQATVLTSDQYFIRVTSVVDPTVSDKNATPFSVIPPISNYYVNDGTFDPSTDQYTQAPGNDANDGLTPFTPKASIRAILETYNVQFGDTIFVDSGTYNLTTNIVITAADAGVRIQGPNWAGGKALLDRGNQSAGSYVFELNNAWAVTLANLWISGGLDGVNVSNSSVNFTLQNCVVYQNASSGL